MVSLDPEVIVPLFTIVTVPLALCKWTAGARPQFDCVASIVPELFKVKFVELWP